MGDNNITYIPLRPPPPTDLPSPRLSAVPSSIRRAVGTTLDSQLLVLSDQCFCQQFRPKPQVTRSELHLFELISVSNLTALSRGFAVRTPSVPVQPLTLILPLTKTPNSTHHHSLARPGSSFPPRREILPINAAGPFFFFFFFCPLALPDQTDCTLSDTECLPADAFLIHLV
jgi:hypothetical protein